MLFTTSQDSIKRAFEYVTKLPFAKHLLHKLSEKARGHCIVYFSLHRVIEQSGLKLHHPHILNRTALTPSQAQRLLTYINRRLPFVSLADSLEYLKGTKKLNRSHAVLLVEVPYVQTIRLLQPLLEELRIPATIILDTESIHDGQMPWTDEIIFRLGSTSKAEISVTFIDRSFSLKSPAERMNAAQHLIDNLSHATSITIAARMKEIRTILAETAIPPIEERICTVSHLEKIALNPLFSFASAGNLRLPISGLSPGEIEKEIVNAKHELSGLFNRAFVPVFFYPTGSDKKYMRDIVRLLINHGYSAGISRNFGVCRPGDNMFHLLRLPLAQGVKSFEQFELQGLSDAIDEFLLVTLGQEREL